ncbi:MAG: alpha/beta hydrolase [Deltaproteobacteria bacterium]|nr:alpha/beta hydrolase [Deltaproteobacteria bacterium]
MNGQDRFVIHQGAKVHYVNYGQGPTALIFIHGWTCNATFWTAQASYFTPRWRVLAVDLPGHGRSDAPHVAYTQEYLARAVHSVMDHAGVNRAVLIGHSMGFQVARQLARLFPDQAAALVSVDGSAWRQPTDEDEFMARKRRLASFVATLRSPQYQQVASSYIDLMFTKMSPPELRHEIKSKMLTTPGHVAASAMEKMDDPWVWSDFVVNVPTLAIYSRMPYVDADNREFLRRLFPSLEYHEFSGTGHFLMMEEPEKFNRVLWDFLEKHQ